MPTIKTFGNFVLVLKDNPYGMESFTGDAIDLLKRSIQLFLASGTENSMDILEDVIQAILRDLKDDEMETIS